MSEVLEETIEVDLSGVYVSRRAGKVLADAEDIEKNLFEGDLYDSVMGKYWLN